MNAFETLGIAPTFALDAATLERRQRDLNRTLHPDRHAQKSPAERRKALSLAMDVNQAYRTLLDPRSRAEALLALLGEESGAERTVADPVLLMDMMEQRERLEEARKAADRELLAELGRAMSEREREVVAALERAFSQLLERLQPGDAARGDVARTEALAAVHRALGELRYVRRFSEELGAALDEI